MCGPASGRALCRDLLAGRAWGNRGRRLVTRDRTDGGGQGDKGAGGWCISTQELSRQEPPPPRRPGLGLQDVPRPFGQHLPTTLCHSQAIWRLRSSPEGPHKPCPAGQAHLVWETPADESSPWRYLSPERGDTSPGPWGPACPEVASVPSRAGGLPSRRSAGKHSGWFCTQLYRECPGPRGAGPETPSPLSQEPHGPRQPHHAQEVPAPLRVARVFVSHPLHLHPHRCGVQPDVLLHLPWSVAKIWSPPPDGKHVYSVFQSQPDHHLLTGHPPHGKAPPQA